MVANCFDLQTLRDYLAGKAEADLEAEIEEHLLSCSACQAVAIQQPAAGDSLLKEIRRSAKVAESPVESDLNHALQAIAALDPAATIPSVARKRDSDMGRLIRDYELQRKLGEGGMGAVYLATHTRLKKHVAVKLLKAERMGDASAIARFSAEMEAVGKLDHPHIVRALDAGEENGVHFLVMEYLAGIDLNRIVRSVGKLSLSDACELIRQAAIGLQHAHENEVIHRDVKPSNLMLLPSGKVKVLDLGLAHFRPSLPELQDLTQAHHVLGTMLYVAPEQLIAGGKVDARSDIFSLGMALYELLLGRLPSRQGLCVQASAEEMASRTDVPSDIWQLAAQMTSLDLTQRPASMAIVAEKLRPWAVGANLSALLQRAGGYTSLVGQPQVQVPSALGGANMQLVAAGIPLAEPPLPPPSSAAFMSSPTPAEQRPAPNRLIWGTAGVMSLVALLLMALIINNLNWSGGSGEPRPLPPPPVGTVTIHCKQPTYRKVLNDIFDEGQVFAESADHTRVPLRFGKNSLPPGKYTIVHKQGDYRVLPQKFEVAKDAEILVTPEVGFIFPWLYPQLPPEPGEFCEYDGRLWHLGLGVARAESELSFDLLLKSGPLETRDGVKHQWLKVVLQDQRHGIKETAWLLLNLQDWQSRQQLTIKEGFLRLESAEIRDALDRTLGEDAPQSIVADFDPQEDTLAAKAVQYSVSLPARANVHQVLVLLFGATFEGAPPIVRQVRGSLPIQREFELIDIDTPEGSRHGLRMTAKSATSLIPGTGITVQLDRCESLPFSFANLDVQSPVFAGKIKLNSFEPATEALAAESVPIAQFRRDNDALPDSPPIENAFDVVTFPAEDGVGAVFTGGITMPNSKVFYNAEVRMLGSTKVDDVPHRWLRLSVRSGSSGLNHRESALLLIDEEAYSSGDFVVHHGWFTCGGHTFNFDPSGEIDKVQLALHLLGEPLPVDRMSVHDVISLLFGGRLAAARFSGVRAQIADEILRTDRKRTHEFVTAELRGTREVVRASAYELKPLEGTTPSSSYRIVRSGDVPFDFMEVRAKLAQGVVLTAELQRTLRSKALEPVDEDEESERVFTTVKATEAAAKLRPNWRMWNVKDRDEPLWAEYGGQAGGKVLLRNNDDEIGVYTYDDLPDEADREAIKQGRTWQGPDNKELFRGELVRSEEPNARYRFQLFSNASAVQVRRLTEFSDIDRRLMKELEKLLPRDSKVKKETLDKSFESKSTGRRR